MTDGTSTVDVSAIVKSDNGIVLQWRDIRYSVTKKGKGDEPDVKVILDGLSGDTYPGRLLALMGPSGSGKTSLLNALAFRVPKGPGAEILGAIYADGELVETPAQVRTGKQTPHAKLRVVVVSTVDEPTTCLFFFLADHLHPARQDVFFFTCFSTIPCARTATGAGQPRRRFPSGDM